MRRTVQRRGDPHACCPQWLRPAHSWLIGSSSRTRSHTGTSCIWKQIIRMLVLCFELVTNDMVGIQRMVPIQQILIIIMRH